MICKALRLVEQCGKAASRCLIALLSSNTHQGPGKKGHRPSEFLFSCSVMIEASE